MKPSCRFLILLFCSNQAFCSAHPRNPSTDSNDSTETQPFTADRVYPKLPATDGSPMRHGTRINQGFIDDLLATAILETPDAHYIITIPITPEDITHPREIQNNTRRQILPSLCYATVGWMFGCTIIGIVIHAG